MFDAIDGDTIVTISQELLADQTTAAGTTVTWSGYYDLGDFALNSLSRVWQGGAGSTIFNTGGGTAARSVMTATAMIVTEVPAVIPAPAALPGALALLGLVAARRTRGDRRR